VASILPFIRKAGAVFDDRATQIIGEAFDSACKEFHDTGQTAGVYEAVARHIIDAGGEQTATSRPTNSGAFRHSGTRGDHSPGFFLLTYFEAARLNYGVVLWITGIKSVWN
jgi:hypothetical protein